MPERDWHRYDTFRSGWRHRRLVLNFTNPNATVDGERSSVKSPHSFFIDIRARTAFCLAIDRIGIAQSLYGRAGIATPNLLEDPPRYRSTNNIVRFDSAKANELLDEAGWTRREQGYREKDGVALAVLFQTSITPSGKSSSKLLRSNGNILASESS